MKDYLYAPAATIITWGDEKVTDFTGRFPSLQYPPAPWPALALEQESSCRCLRPKNRGPDQRAPVISRATEGVVPLTAPLLCLWV